MRPSRLFYLIFVSLLISCGVRKGEIRINGSIEGITQGDFLILNTEGGTGTIDTLHILHGDFDYESNLEDEGTYCIIYPNNTQLVLWLHSGDHITIEGKALDLWHITVKGNDENELYNEFRQQTVASDTIKLRQEAARIIREHPDSRVSCFLFTQYFVIPNDVPLDSIQSLYKAMHDAAPDNPNVASLGGQIQQRSILRVGQKMPDFSLITTDSVSRNLKQYRGKTLFFYFWAGWQGTSTIIHNELLHIKDEQENTDPSNPISILGYCLDVDQTTMTANMNDEARDRIPTYCDHQGFNGALATQLGVKDVPLVIVVDPTGKIKHIFTDILALRRQYGK